MRDTILITGWRGPTGNAIVRALAAKFPERHFVGLSRPEKRPDAPDADVTARINSEEIADLYDEAAVSAAFAKYGERIGVVVHVAHISFTPMILRQAEAFDVPQSVLVHTTGIHSRYKQYTEGYRLVEDALFAKPPTRTAYTILRPTMIYGTPRDRNMHKLVGHIARKRPLPLFGGAPGRMQPIHVDDLAMGVAGAAGNSVALNKAYDLSGGSMITYREAVETIGGELNIRPVLVPIPLAVGLPMARLAEKILKHSPITEEQILRLQEDKCYSHADATRDLGFSPCSFAEGIRQEIALMRAAGLIPSV